MTQTIPKRRWFQFGLRTMFVVVTVVAVATAFVAYHVNWIRQRHEFLKIDGAYDWSNEYLPSKTPRPRAPGLLWVFGEKGIRKVIVYADGEADFSRAEALFPEAKRAKRYAGRPRIKSSS